ncbi:MAG: hypothetical protein WDN44_14465 [Sphingomonas sp.]
MFDWRSMFPVADPMILAIPVVLFLLAGWIDYRFRCQKADCGRVAAV